MKNETMKEKLFYIKDKKMLFVTGQATAEPVPNGVYDGVVRRMTDSPKRNEWKNTGRGAMFTGTYTPGTDAASVASSIRSEVTCVGAFNDNLLFTEQIGGTGAIYRKTSIADMSEVIAFSDTAYSIESFDTSNTKIAVSASYAHFAHIGTLEPSGRGGVSIITEGESIDKNPSFDKSNPNVLYYESAGILLAGEDEPDEPEMMTPAEMMRTMRRMTQTGPSAIVRINFTTSTLDYILEDENTSYIKPQTDKDGTLYFIRKPYKDEQPKGEGFLTSLVMVPVRFFSALGGFFNFFSMKYSGQTLTNNGTRAKGKDEKQIFIDGNLIDAEKALKENSGEQNPGIIPKSFELCRLSGGEIEVVMRGVIAFTFDPDGNVVYSNGNTIVRINTDGKEERLVNDKSAEGVTCLKFIDIDF